MKCVLQEVDALGGKREWIAKVAKPFEVKSSIDFFAEQLPYFHMDGVRRRVAKHLRLTVSRHMMFWHFTEEHLLHAVVKHCGIFMFTLQRDIAVHIAAKRRKPRKTDSLEELSEYSSEEEADVDVPIAGDGGSAGGSEAAGEPMAPGSSSAVDGGGVDTDAAGTMLAVELALARELRGESEADVLRESWVADDKAETSEDLVAQFERKLVDLVLKTAVSGKASEKDKSKAVSTVMGTDSTVGQMLHAAVPGSAAIDIDEVHDALVLDSVAFEGSSRPASSSGAPRATPAPWSPESKFATWQKDASVGKQLLQDTCAATRTLLIGRSDTTPWELSLLASPPDHVSPCVAFVQWSYPLRRKGRAPPAKSYAGYGKPCRFAA